MKIRNGYVSNSSSSSFVLMASVFNIFDYKKATESLFDFYNLRYERRMELYSDIYNINENKEGFFDFLSSILNFCNGNKSSIVVKFGDEENGLEEGFGYFIYYSDYSDNNGYYDEKEPDDPSPYIETSKKLQAICEKNSLDLSNIKVIRGITCD